jgi:hypothetical protein
VVAVAAVAAGGLPPGWARTAGLINKLLINKLAAKTLPNTTNGRLDRELLIIIFPGTSTQKAPPSLLRS